MRPVLVGVIAMLGGCVIQPHDDGYDYPPPPDNSGWGSGWGGGGGTSTYGCHSDTECPTSFVCARTGACLEASQVRKVHTHWTVQGETATETTCSAVPDLSITFSSTGGEQFGFTPVPCRLGLHTVDKIPTWYTTVQLARAYDYSGGDVGTFDTAGDAFLDLPY